MAMQADEYLLESVNLVHGDLEVTFADGMEGMVSRDELSVGDKISQVNSKSIVQSDGKRIQFTLTNGDTADYPWDFFRRLLDEGFREQEEQEARSARVNLGKNLRTLRKDRSLSQEQLAERAGVDRTTISRIERGTHQASFDTLHRLAGGLQVPIQEVVTLEDEPAESTV